MLWSKQTFVMENIFKRFKSQTISDIKIRGLNPKTRIKITNFFKPLSQFIGFVFVYTNRKIKKLGKLFITIVRTLKNSVVWAKEYTTKKLIWSRGRLGRPIANFIVLVVAFIVFTFGEILNSSRFVNSQEINPDYLSTITDIIPNTNTALTTVPDDRKQTESFAYTVQGGDTLSSIGQRFKISTDALQYVNGLTDDSLLSVGDTLTIPPVSGLIHTIEDGDTLASIADTYSVPQQAIADFNYILDTSSLAVGSELVIPGAQVPEPVYVAPVPSYIAPSYAPSAPNLGDGFIWPTTTNIITQYFSWYHDGLDIAVPWSWGMPPLFASSSGTVTRAGWDPWGLGLHVRIDHGNGFETVYGHMSRVDVGYGQRVNKGQVIGLMGNTGRSTGPHVHFIVKYGGVAQDPLRYIN